MLGDDAWTPGVGDDLYRYDPARNTYVWTDKQWAELAARTERLVRDGVPVMDIKIVEYR